MQSSDNELMCRYTPQRLEILKCAFANDRIIMTGKEEDSQTSLQKGGKIL